MNSAPLRLLVLGRGKTGALVAEVARERGHQVQSLASGENRDAAWLTPEHLLGFDVVIDFTTPHAVVANIEACLRERKAMVVGTTGWYGELDRVRQAVEKAGTGFVFGANFSYGVNLFFQIVQAAAPALEHNYRGAYHRAAPHPQEGCAVGDCRSSAAVTGAGIGGTRRDHLRARRRRDRHPYAGVDFVRRSYCANARSQVAPDLC